MSKFPVEKKINLSIGITSVLREGPAGPQESLPWHRKQPLDIFENGTKPKNKSAHDQLTISTDHVHISQYTTSLPPLSSLLLTTTTI